MSFLYAVLSSFMCGTCLLVIGSANPIHAILLLIRVFFRGTILLFCLQIEYYAILFLIVYVGAIVVLFLFIIIRLELKRVNVATRLGDLFSFRHLIFLCFVFQRFFFISNQFLILTDFFFNNHLWGLSHLISIAYFLLRLWLLQALFLCSINISHF